MTKVIKRQSFVRVSDVALVFSISSRNIRVRRNWALTRATSRITHWKKALVR